MVRTRKRFYGEEISQSSSNIAYSGRKEQDLTSRLKQERTHIKRSRFHMAHIGGKESLRGRIKRALADCQDLPVDPMFKACHGNRDAFIKLLLSACNGTDNGMGSPRKGADFWKKFTKRFVREIKLDIVVSQETVDTCEEFARSLKNLHRTMENTSRSIEKNIKEQECQPQQLRQPLFNIFGTRKPCFQRKNSSGSSSKYGRSSKSARSINSSRFSDARGPSGASQSLMQDVSDDWNEWEPRLAAALHALYNENLVTVTQVDQVSDQFRKSTTRVGLRIFLAMHQQADQVKYIQDMLANIVW